MKCWKCGRDIAAGADTCIYCGTKIKRPEPASDAGKALRQLYDHYGAESLLSDPVLLSNGFGDLCPDDKKIRNQLKLALDAGISKLYLAQINATGKPDSSFLQRVRTILSEDAGLSEKAIQDLIKAFDEMIGWPTDNSVPQACSKTYSANSDAKQTNNSRPQPIENKRIERADSGNNVPNGNSNKSQSLKKIVYAIIAIVIVGTGILLLINGNNKHNNNQVAESSNKSTQSQTLEASEKSSAKNQIRPEILSIKWSEEDEGVIIRYKKNGVSGTYWCWLGYGNKNNATPSGGYDIEEDTGAEIVEYCEHSLDFIPGETLTFWIRAIQGNDYIDSDPQDLYIPITNKKSPITVTACYVDDLDASVLEKLYEEVAVVYYNEGYDAYKAIATPYYKAAVNTNFVTSGAVTVLITSPSGTKHAIRAYGDTSVKEGDYLDFRDSLASSFAFHSLPIEKGKYTLQLYDTDERCLLGTWYFNVK